MVICIQVPFPNKYTTAKKLEIKVTENRPEKHNTFQEFWSQLTPDQRLNLNTICELALITSKGISVLSLDEFQTTTSAFIFGDTDMLRDVTSAKLVKVYRESHEQHDLLPTFEAIRQRLLNEIGRFLLE